MTAKQAAEKLEISVDLVYDLCAEGRLPHIRIGKAGCRGKIVIREKDIDAFVKKLEGAKR